MSKQDRVFTRTPSDLERKYNLGKFFSKDGIFTKMPDQMQQLEKTLTEFINETNDKISKLQKKMKNIYGEGSFYVSVYEDDPADMFGGEWELYLEGYIVVSQDETIGGTNSLLPSQDKCYVWKRIS